MGSRPPLGCWVPKQGPSPRPGRRMAQEAFEAYGKSSPLPALPHLPFPPSYVPPPVSMGTGGSRHGTLSTMRRRGNYRRGATAAGDPGVRGLYHGEGREGPKRNLPPPRSSQVPHPVLVSCLSHACDLRATKRRRQGTPSPPHPPPPPRGRGKRVGGGEKRPPPPPRTTRQDGEAAVGGCGTNHTNVPEEGTRRASPGGGTTEGASAGRKGRQREPRGMPPPCRGTGAAPRTRALLASSLRHECNEGKTTSPPPPHTSAPPRVGEAGREGRTAAPPSRGQSGKMGRQRGEGAGRTTRPCPREARAVQAPAGGAPGERAQSGKGDDGGQAACPTPQQKDKCRATCQRRACNVLTPEEGRRGHPPPLPTPNSHTHLGKGRGQRGDGEGTWGMTVAGSGPPPRGHRGKVGRRWKESAGRTTQPCLKGARPVQAPTGGPPGVRPQER